MADLIDIEIKEVWNFQKYGAADRYYETQFNCLLQQCAEKDILPFFDHVKKDIPENILNRDIMNDINKTSAELHSAAIGAKGNHYIFGKDANTLRLTLDKKKNMAPLLVCAGGKFSNVQPMSFEMNVAESGAKATYQFMYNIEQFDERSQKRLAKMNLEYTQPQFKKEKEQRKKEARALYKENMSQKQTKDKFLNLYAKNGVASQEDELQNIFTAVMIHNIAQKHGGFDLVGDKYTKAEYEIVAKGKLKEQLEKARKAIGDGSLSHDAIMRAVFKGQETAALANSKNVEFTQSRNKDDIMKAKQNTKRIEYGFSR